MASISNFGALEIYNRNQRAVESSAAIFPHHSRCDFCDVTLICDLDCSRHLTSQVHSRNKDEFISTQNFQDKVVEKNTPKSLAQVFESIKVRAPRDLTELADKGYFDIVDEIGYEIAEEMAKILFKSIIEFQTAEFPPESKKVIMSAMKPHEGAYRTKPATTETMRPDQAPSNSKQPIPESSDSISLQAQTSSKSGSSSRSRQGSSSDRPSQTSITEKSLPSEPSSPTQLSSSRQLPSVQHQPSSQQPSKKVPTAKRSTPLPPLPTPVRDKPSTSTTSIERNKRPATRSPAREAQPTGPKTTRTQSVGESSRVPPAASAKALVKKPQPTTTSNSTARPHQHPSPDLRSSPPVRQVPAPVRQYLRPMQQSPILIQRPTVQPVIEVNLPVAQLGSPNAPIRYPNAPIRTPNAPIRYPNAPIQTPNAPIRTPNAPIRTPNAPIRTPNAPIRSQSISIRQHPAELSQAATQTNPPYSRGVGHTIIRHPAPVPNPNNQYIPILSTIKTEPRDN